MLDMKCIILDDGDEYFIIDEVEVDGIIYTLFSNIRDEKNIKIRKIVVQSDGQYYVGIDDENEIKKVILAFDKKINS